VVSNAEIKLLRNLSKKRFREKHGQFLIEGPKLLEEAAASEWNIAKVFALESEVDRVESIAPGVPVSVMEPPVIKEITQQVTPSGIIALLSIPSRELELSHLFQEPVLLLDGLRDPGNVGTILRSADWFGVRRVVLSNDCVDIYNPKVVQSSMGSLFRVQAYYADLEEILKDQSANGKTLRVAGAALQGQLLDTGKGLNVDAIIIGSESHGIRPELLEVCNELVRIPGGEHGTESLNASIAASILLYQWLSPRS